MDGYRRLVLLSVLVGLLGVSGAHCPRRTPYYGDPLPRALPPSPSLEQVIDVVNRNNSQIGSYWTSRARLSGPGFPTLSASVAFERPLRFRLRADTALTGPELDLGSNHEHFWFWVKRNRPPAVFFCRHDQFHTGRARQMIPIDPYWLIEALGTAEFDRGLPHQGPFPASKDRLEIHTVRDTPEGPMIKSTVVDAIRGVVLEQRIYDPGGRLLASSVAAGHRRDPASGLVMPTSVDINCPPAQFSMRIDLGNVQINRLPSNPAGLWQMPNDPNLQFVDLCRPPAASPLSPPPGASPGVSLHPRSPTQQWPRRTH